MIGIPFYVWDMADRFHADVVDDFVAEYAAGRTPNPCLRCNEKIKFAAVLDRAVALGFDAVVTGHHARLGADGLLRRSVDLAKDQSYVLAVLTREQLDRSMFPLGDSTKARGPRGGRPARPGGRRQARLARHLLHRRRRHPRLPRASGSARPPGDVVDAVTGAVVGSHTGAYAYTVGQRRGLHLDRPAPDGRPRYVLSITPKTNTVTVGPAEALEVSEVRGDPSGLDRRRAARPRRSSARCSCGRTATWCPRPSRSTADGLRRRAAPPGPRGRRRSGHRGVPAGPGRRRGARLRHHHRLSAPTVTLATNAATFATVRWIFSSRVSDSWSRPPAPASFLPRTYSEQARSLQM